MGVVDSSIFNNKQAKCRHSLQFWRLWACLLPSLQQRQRLLHGTDMVASTATAFQPMEAMAMVVTMARGLLMLSPRLRLMPGTGMVAFTDMASQPMADMAMVDTTARSKILSLTSPTA